MKTLTSLLILVVFASCKEDKSSDNATITIPNYAELAALDVKLSQPKDGDWLKQHEEKGQTFDDYVAKNPITTSWKRDVIYLQPIGEFTAIEKKMFDLTTEYISYFFGVKTVMLETISANVIPKEKKRIEFGTEQLDASYIINEILPNEIPSDGIVIMGLTARDLYPKPEWNFVFGLASYSKRTAVTSMFRFTDSTFMDENYSMCLARLIKTSSHEISHMFTVNHCINGVCLMNGANHIVELDSQPNALCSVCLAKLSWNLKFDDAKRLKLLIAFLKKHKLDSDAVILQNQLNVIMK